MEELEYKKLEFKRSHKRPYLSLQDLKALMDLALDTRDKDWMRELYVKMKYLSDIITYRE